MKRLFPLLTAAFALTLTACGKFQAQLPKRELAQTGSQVGAQALQFERSNIVADAKDQASLTGRCIAGQSIEVQVTDAVAARQEVCPAGGAFSFNLALPGADGAKTIVISSRDGAGRMWSDSVTIVKDSTPPDIRIINATCVDSSKVVSGSCESGTNVTISGQLTQSVTALCQNGLFQANVNYTSGDGVKNFSIAQADRLGNQASIAGSCTVRPPVTQPQPPVVTIQTPAANAFVGNTVQLVGACTVGINVVLYGPGTSASAGATCTSGLYSGTVTLTAGEGSKEIRVGQTGPTGLNSVATRVVIKDTVSPSLTITQPAAGVLAPTGVTLQGTCETGLPVRVLGAGVASMVSVNCNASAFSSAITFSAGDGSKLVTVEQTDAAGNKSTVSRTFNKGDLGTSGAILYANHCAACHGTLNVSTKLGRTASQITGAINTMVPMAALKSLSAQQVEAIAAALVVSPTTIPPTTDADRFFLTTNPNLYNAGRKYFPGDDTQFPRKRIFRLTRQQLDMTVRSLLPTYFTTSVAAAVPRDPLQTNYEYAENISVNSSNFTPLNDWLQAIVGRVRANPAAVINCASSNNSATCLQSQARSFVLKAFRGDVTDAKIAQYSAILVDSVASQGISGATADFVDVVISSPLFLFREEFATDSAGKLVAAEHLQALTYTLADAPAEQVRLSSLTAATHVQNATAARASADAILATPEAREKLIRFFRSWLEVKEPNEFTISRTDFPEFTPAVAQAVVEETNRFLNHHLSKAVPNLKDITQSTQSFVSRNIASIYDMDGTNLTGTTPVNLDQTKRLGIFSQSAVLASHSGPTDTRLVKRGVFWVRKVMCQELEPPPASVNTELPPAQNTTERQRIETGTSLNACVGCHSKINPFGFIQENYNAIGKWRTLDNGFAIDASISTNMLDEGNVTTNQPVDAYRAFTKSVMFKQCFVRQLFRYYMGRDETPADHRTLREMFYYFSDGDKQEIVTLLQILANSQRLSHRQ